MLKKYYVSITNVKTSNIEIYIINSIYDENDLMNVLKKMYNKHIIHIERYNYQHHAIITICDFLKNVCVAKNVKRYI